MLLADDDSTIRVLYGKRLRREGLTVIEAGDGIEALVQASQLPDLAILDLRMPLMTGLEVLRRLKAGPGTACIPVVIFTNETDPEPMAAALAAGAAG